MPCTVSLSWLVCALAASLVGWGLFAFAAVYSVHHHVAMRGYEWVWGFLIMPMAWVCVSGIRRGSGFSDAERIATENERFIRMIVATILVGGGIVGALIAVPYAWLLTDAAVAAPLLALARAPELLHSPQPQPTPSASAPPSAGHHSQERTTVGVMLLFHLVVLCVGLLAYWQYGENWRIEEAKRDETDAFHVSDT
jgi:hypothetical protein